MEGLEDTVLSEVKQAHEDKGCAAPLPEAPGVGTSTEVESGCVHQGLGRGNGNSMFDGNRVSVCKDGQVLEMDRVTVTQQSAFFKRFYCYVIVTQGCFILSIILSSLTPLLKTTSTGFFSSLPPFLPLSLPLSSLLFLFFKDMNLLCSPGWPQTHYFPASASGMLELQACTTMPDFSDFLKNPSNFS
jgi:hypothetical protein